MLSPASQAKSFVQSRYTLSRLKRNTAFATSTTPIVSNPELQITTQSIDDGWTVPKIADNGAE
jgi:hypothetical protein